MKAKIVLCDDDGNVLPNATWHGLKTGDFG